jgi:diketogulonate reductase-like aldo/keto reductase
VSLAWLLSKDRVAPIPKAADFGHVEANWAAREIHLTDDQIARIDAVDRDERVVDFEGAPWNRG